MRFRRSSRITTTSANSLRLEHQEQAALFAWARLAQGRYPELRLLNASLSGVRLFPGQARKAKSLGMVRGFPDVFLPVRKAGYGGLFIELKRPRGGKITPEQRAWLEELGEQGYLAVCCRGFEEARTVIQSYLSEKLQG